MGTEKRGGENGIEVSRIYGRTRQLRRKYRKNRKGDKETSKTHKGTEKRGGESGMEV